MKHEVDPVVRRHGVVGFRWVKPAASLKRRERWGDERMYTCFRWVKPAASLKHRIGGGKGGNIVAQFPLGKTGGLIEARTARR